MKLALKVDVGTHRGTREGVPRLLEILARRAARATFLFSLGRDHSGRAVKRYLWPGARKKPGRFPPGSRGLATMLYGTLLPAPDIGRIDADIMRAARDAGHETGIHTYDRFAWQDGAIRGDARWTQHAMELACARYEDIFKEPARTHGAADWQMNPHAFRLTQRLGFHYSSDTRGTHPFVPVCNAEITACPQLPTTLPTLDELIGTDGITADNAADHVLRLSEAPRASGHVYTLRAELEGAKLAGVFERLLEGWGAMGFELVTLHDYAADLELARTPRHVVVLGEVPGRATALACQGGEFLC